MTNGCMSGAAEAILKLYGFEEAFAVGQVYIQNADRDDYFKLIFRVDTAGGGKLVVKLLHEDKNLQEEREKIENQCAFSEFLRKKGIRTPMRHRADGRYCNEFIFMEKPLNATLEDWCGEEITEITVETARRIGELMARMHVISLENECRIGCGTLFSAAYWNDVDVFQQFCELTKDKRLDQGTVDKIKALRGEKLKRLRSVWETLPKAAVQGDISINNLTDNGGGLTVFDYNNAGDEVLVSDLVLEGLLTAYEMELPAGTGEAYREGLFPALLKGYLSVRELSEAERAAAWDIYTLYHALWFTRIVYSGGSLEKLVQNEDFEAANRLLRRMLEDMSETDDGRFQGIGG